MSTHPAGGYPNIPPEMKAKVLTIALNNLEREARSEKSVPSPAVLEIVNEYRKTLAELEAFRLAAGKMIKGIDKALEGRDWEGERR